MKDLATSQRLLADTQAQIKRAIRTVSEIRELSVERTAEVKRAKALVNQPVPFLSITETEPAIVEKAHKDQSKNLLELVSERLIEAQVVVLDGKHFRDCTLRNCTLQYAGHPVIVEGTHFEGCTFRFEGQAAMTMLLAKCFRLVGESAPAYDCALTTLGSAFRPN